MCLKFKSSHHSNDTIRRVCCICSKYKNNPYEILTDYLRYQYRLCCHNCLGKMLASKQIAFVLNHHYICA